MLGDSLRAQLAREGIRVTTICPGVRHASPRSSWLPMPAAADLQL